MKHVVINVSLYFIFLISIANAVLLYDNYSDYGISKLFSVGLSVLGCIPVVLLVIFPTKLTVIEITKLLALITMLTLPIVEEYSLYISSFASYELYFYLNVLLAPMAFISMFVLHKNRETL